MNIIINYNLFLFTLIFWAIQSIAHGQIPWNYIYKGNTLPGAPWSRIVSGTPSESLINHGEQTMIQLSTQGTDKLYYVWNGGGFNPNTSVGATVEARIRVNSLAPNASIAQVFFYSTNHRLYGIQLGTTSMTWMDGTAINLPPGFDPTAFNTYRLYHVGGANGTCYLYLNTANAPISSSIGSPYGLANKIFFGDTTALTSYNGSVDWDFIRWTDKGAFSTQQVPQPFTPVLASTTPTTTSVSIWGRTYEWEINNPLPYRISSQGSEILHSAMELQLVGNGAVQAWTQNSRTLLFKNGRKATYFTNYSAGPFTLALTTSTEFDGFTRVTGTLSGSGQTVNSLKIRIPVKSSIATHFHAGNFRTDVEHFDSSYKADAIANFTYHFTNSKTPFASLFWLGSEQAGIQWIAEWDKGWKNANPDEVFHVISTPGVRELEINIIDTPTTLAGSIPIDFAINVTPVKDTSYYWDFAYVNGLSAYIYDNYDPVILNTHATQAAAHGATHTIIGGFGWPFHADIWVRDHNQINFTESIQTYRQAGIKSTYYGLWGYDFTGDEVSNFGEDMMKTPINRGGPGTVMYNPEGRFVDFHVKGLEDAINLYGIEGIYLDTMGSEIASDWILGQEWSDSNGNLRGKWPVFSLRNWMIRLVDSMINSEAGQGLIVSHNSGIPNLAYHSLAHLLVGGEDTPDAATVIASWPLDSYLARYSAHAFGIPVETIWYNWWNRQLMENQVLGVFLLHGQLKIRTGGDYMSWNVHSADYELGTRPHVTLHKMFKEFDVSTAEWWPYYLGAANWVFPGNGLYVSSYLHQGDEALVFLVNLDTGSLHDTPLTFDLAKAGFNTSDILEVSDAYTQSILTESLSIANNTLILDHIHDQRYRILRIKHRPL